jgi:alkylated DNA repair dioxygenase AlkB
MSNPPKGLIYIEDFISNDESKDLMNFIDSQIWSTDITRRTQQYGFKYEYKTASVKEETTPIPKEFKFLNEKLEKYFPNGVDQIIINEYLQNDAIAKHVDATQFFGEVVASISLLVPIGMNFHEIQKKDEEKNPKFYQVLAPNSCVVLSEDARYKWQHEIPRSMTFILENGKKYKKPLDYRRVSITCRTMKK